MAWVQSLGCTERKRDPSLWSCPLTSTHKCYGTCVPTQTYHTYTGIKHGRGLWHISSLLVFHQELPSTQVQKVSPADFSTGIVKDVLKRTSIAQEKKQIDKWNCMKLKSFALKKRNRTCRRREKSLSAIHLTRVPHPEKCNKKEKPENPRVFNQKKGHMNHPDIFQKKYKWQDIHEMSNVLSHHTNDNQNYIETPSVRMTVIKKTKSNKSQRG